MVMAVISIPQVAVSEEPLGYDQKNIEREKRLKMVRENTMAAIVNYEDAVSGVCRAVEAIAQEKLRIEKNGTQAQETRELVRSILYTKNLEEDLASAQVLVGADLADSHRLLALESLESIVEGLRDGILEGARLQRVTARLQLAEEELLIFLACLPRRSVHVAVEIVERENANNAPGYAGIFPWRKSRKLAHGTTAFDPGNSPLLDKMQH